MDDIMPNTDTIPPRDGVALKTPHQFIDTSKKTTLEARETKIQPLIDGAKQFVLPLFQRKYIWDKLQWETLWGNLWELYEENEEDHAGKNTTKSHFIGSIVTIPMVAAPQGVAKYLLIDGQQRLTTIFVLLAAIRDKAKLQDNSKLADKINETLLINRHETQLDYFKILPTEKGNDRVVFIHLIQSELVEIDHQIKKAYLYFERELRRLVVDLSKILAVITQQLSLVSIVLQEASDNPHLVFESLNSTGVRLLPSDLIRNHFFMRIPIAQQVATYNQYWLPMETKLGDKTLTEFIRHYLKREGGVVKESEVYFKLKEKIKDENAVQELQQLAKCAAYYHLFIHPNLETNAEIRQLLLSINTLEVTTAYPFLLNCYEDYAEKKMTATDFIQVLKVIDNFLMRRYLANVPTNQLDKIFPPLYKQVIARTEQDFVSALKTVLQTKNYPKDTAFRKAIESAKLYGSGDKNKKTKLLLSMIEQYYGHKEQVALEILTIEHLLPQTISTWWKNHLGENWEETHDLYLHTLGNLTLTAYNSELSNENFEEKKKILTKSHLELNHYFHQKENWREADIKERTAYLSDICLKIWAYFGENASKNTTIVGTRPSSLIIWGIEYAVKYWVDVLEQTVKSIADLAPEKLEVLIKAYPRFIGHHPQKFKRPSEVVSGLYVEKNLSAESIQRFCMQAMQTIELTSDDWVVRYYEV
jgi:uncharacterized protein with ParB-like and HNH nuclease domain